MGDIVRETVFYTDDVKTLADLLKDNWSLGPNNMPNVGYDPTAFMASARVGMIYVYKVSASNRISSTDYQSLDRTVNLSIRVSNPDRARHFEWCQEVYRILLANRRCHDKLGGYLFLELASDRETNELTAFYVTTFEVKMTRYNKPVVTAGLGDKVNKKIADLADNTGESS